VSTSPRQPAASALNANVQAAAMVVALKNLLDQVPGSRQALPHLAALERDLGRHGLAVLGKAPTPALLKASQQLARLPLPADGKELQRLGHLLLDEIDARSRPSGDGLRSDFHTPDRLHVSEGSHTDFMVAAGLAEPKKPG